MNPGRACPLHYRYSPSVFNRPPDVTADTLYVIGGLYGNGPALDEIFALADAEPSPVVLIFNGDFNWFNVDGERFAEINRGVLAHTALRGNVETELASDDSSAGCGCAYPAFVADAEVERSNRILERLKTTARAQPDPRHRLGELPMHLTARVGDLAIGIVHGDAQSLAGWQFDVSTLDAPDSKATIGSLFAIANVDAFASSHTCLPAAREFFAAGRQRWVFNNGAAGMPNFAGSRYGVVTRISRHAAKQSLYGARLADVFIDALPVRYDHARWLAEFLANWPPGSPGHTSYYRRITQGPAYTLARAAPYNWPRPATAGSIQQSESCNSPRHP